MWQNWLLGILGLWVILMPFVLSDTRTSLIVTGVVIAVLGFWAASGSKAGMM